MRPSSMSSRGSSPRAAAPMLELTLASKAPKVARDWLEIRAGHAIAGLIPVAAGKGKLADAALEYLRAQKRKGHEAFIRDCLASAPPEAAEKVRREVLERAEVVHPGLRSETTPEWLRTALDGAEKLTAPSWVGPGDLPTILVGDRAAERAAGRSAARRPGQEHARMRPIRSWPPSRPMPIAGRSTPSPGHSSSAGSPRARPRRRNGPWARWACSAPTGPP